jgi:hypothetical protein
MKTEDNRSEQREEIQPATGLEQFLNSFTARAANMVPEEFDSVESMMKCVDQIGEIMVQEFDKLETKAPTEVLEMPKRRT